MPMWLEAFTPFVEQRTFPGFALQYSINSSIVFHGASFFTTTTEGSKRWFTIGTTESFENTLPFSAASELNVGRLINPIV